MERMFREVNWGSLKLSNRFVLPPIKLAYGTPDGAVTDRQLIFYRQIAKNGPALLISEPVAVTQEGKEHPRQLCVHLPASAQELQKVADVIHAEGGMACLHLNHAGAAANPMATKTEPRAPSPVTCPVTGKESLALTQEEIDVILTGYRQAAETALKAGYDAIEVQCGHGYLVSQFLNSKINRRTDRYSKEMTLFAREVLGAVKTGAPGLPFLVRISGSEMSSDLGISPNDMLPLFKVAEESGAVAVHVGMGSSCFSPPWYFHHGSLPEKPQMDALAWVRKNISLPLIAAGRMGRKEKILSLLDNDLTDLVALGRPLIASPGLIESWRTNDEKGRVYCGYCIQGCLPRVKTGEGIGCNINPEVGRSGLNPSDNPLKVLVAGGGPAGMSAALYLTRRGHNVTLVEAEDHLGGQFNLAWQAPGKEGMRETLASFEKMVRQEVVEIVTGREVDADLVRQMRPDLLVWATGAIQNIPETPGLDSVNSMTSIEYFNGVKKVLGPRVLVIGAGRIGVEIAEKLGKDGFETVATKRTDPIGSAMEPITKTLALKRIEGMKNVTFMPHTTVKSFNASSVEVEKNGELFALAPFQTVILTSGMLPHPAPPEELAKMVKKIETIGDAHRVMDIFSAVDAGYNLSVRY